MSKRLSPQPLGYYDIRNSSECHTSHEAGKQLLVNLMNAGEVAVTCVKLSLRCKLKKTRIEVPVRSVHCRPHLECVDLRNYLDCEAKNSATIGAPRSTSRSQRPLWTCPVCGERARADDLRVDDYFAHILASFPASVDEVQLHPDGSFEQLSGAGSDVTIDDEEPFEPQPEDFQTEPSGPGRAVVELLKQSKSFQLTLQDGKNFRTKNAMREAMESFLEAQRDALSSLLKRFANTNQNDDSLDEPMETEAIPAGQDQPQCTTLAADGEQVLREEPHKSRKLNETQPCELEAETNRADKAESDASQLRDENDRLRKELATKVHENRELTATNQELQARQDAMRTASDAIMQMNREPVESGSLSMERDPRESSFSLTAGDAANDADEAATVSGPSAVGESQLEHKDCSSSDSSISLVDLSESTEMESDSDGDEQPGHAPKQRKKNQNGHFACAECDRVFNDRSHLSRHQRTHNGEKPYQCAQCGTAFAQSSNLRKHERIHTGEKPYKCGQCGKAFAYPSRLRKHERLHTGAKPYKCGQCGKAFADPRSRRTHERVHTGEKPYQCADCGKAFADPSSLLKHERIHTGEKPYQCAQCDKAFARVCSLRQHERLHTGAKPYNHLRAHERLHTGEKPYKCGQCGKAFADPSSRRKHERVHTGLKPYKCGLCGNAFADPSSRRKHERVHTGVKPYKCGHCDKAFISSSHLRKHERTQHPVAGPSKEAKKGETQARSQSEV